MKTWPLHPIIYEINTWVDDMLDSDLYIDLRPEISLFSSAGTLSEQLMETQEGKTYEEHP